jgi:hypothetical protein
VPSIGEAESFLEDLFSTSSTESGMVAATVRQSSDHNCDTPTPEQHRSGIVAATVRHSTDRNRDTTTPEDRDTPMPEQQRGDAVITASHSTGNTCGTRSPEHSEDSMISVIGAPTL